MQITSRSKLLFQSVRLKFINTHIIPFSSGLLLAILKNLIRVWLGFDKNSVKPVYKTLVRVWFDSLVYLLVYFCDAFLTAALICLFFSTSI